MPNKALYCSNSAFPSTPLQGRHNAIRAPRSNWILSRPGFSLIRPSRSTAVSASSSSSNSSSSSSSPTLLPTSIDRSSSNEPLDPLEDVEICHVETLPTQNSLQEALASLEIAVAEKCKEYNQLRSGLLRLEVPLPRSISALHWLRGQSMISTRDTNNEGNSTTATEASLFPRILFSPRRSSAPDTEGSIAAGAASAGAGSVAGAGAAWLWKGQSGQPINGKSMASMQRFLNTDHPRVRVFGGSRFDPKSHAAPEWEEFGSYCFVLPRIEVLELSGCSMVACTLAWDAAATSATSSSGGYNTLEAAATAAISALHSTLPPSPPHAPAPRLTQLSMNHLPSEDEWASRLDAVHAELVPATSSSSTTSVTDVTFGMSTDDYSGSDDEGEDADFSSDGTGNAFTYPLQKLSPDVALEEYLRNGQQGLDELLAALDSGFEAIVSASGSSSEDSEGDDVTAAAATTATTGSNSNNGSFLKNNSTAISTKKNGSNGSTTTASSHKNNQGMSKIVLARRTDLHLQGHLDPLTILEALQERDPRAYQVYLQLESGTTFLASTPECLYTRSGSDVASEAVAGTRARGSGGDVEKDFWLAFDLLRSQKDDVEFGVVRDWVRRALGTVCDDVRVEITKSVLKQGSVQHLYGKLAGKLKNDIGDAALLSALHPTPAVCGQPRSDALKMLSEVETFDRGLYSGPFGWISRDAAEFVVAIRSALIRPRHPTTTTTSDFSGGNGGGNGASTTASNGASSSLSAYDVALFAGVGIVCGSDTASEWAELNLKISQFERLLKPAPLFSSSPNISSLWARVMVEELCRLGCNTFCVAPGSRSSPLTVAIASHPRAKIVPCIDERSLGFWALGYGRARGLPAVVVTSSGTAVANLLPAVVEASQSHVPMLLLTADRPFELRETGANQTIDQVNIFGSYTRWDYDLESPLESTTAMNAVERVGEAVRAACATHALPPGPVHLNCQFREPLAPKKEEFESFKCFEGVGDWETSHKPLETSFSAVLPHTDTTNGSSSFLENNADVAALLNMTRKARRGLLLIGELIQPQDVAAIVQLAQILGWPIAADVLSGIKIGAQPPHKAPLKLISHFDHLLLDSTHWKTIKPDVVLQIGGHITSKRVAQFLEWCCCCEEEEGASSSTVAAAVEVSPKTSWLFVSRAPLRQDQGPNVSLRVKATVPELVSAFQQQEQVESNGASTAPKQQQQQQQAAYCQLLQTLDMQASSAIDTALEEFVELTEPAVARVLSQELPPGEGLFIGNSMPIRDLDMYGMPAVREMHAEVVENGNGSNGASSTSISSTRWSPQGVVHAGVGAPVAANRGASGIDGVLSTAAGFADGLQRGTTLVVGDISFLHDVNGLNLLRSGDMHPPLTVVLVNNGGGGIFSFLPIADHIPDEVFTPLWATPQNVDLAGMCRAHGIPHIKVASPEELRTALHSAWGLNRHSVIEAITDREANVIRHREIQNAVKDALSTTFSSAPSFKSSFSGISASKSNAANGGGSITGATCSQYELPLQRPVTTSQGSSSSDALEPRKGIFIFFDVKSNDKNALSATTRVAGEVAPLPGLHKETLEQAHAQTRLVCELFSSAAALPLPESAELFEGWLKTTLSIDAKALFPSVRFGLEGAVLSAMAAARGMTLDEILISSLLVAQSSEIPLKLSDTVFLNAMIDPQGDSELATEMALSLKLKQQQQNFSFDGRQCVKIKVGRANNLLDDVAVVRAVYNAFSGDVKIRLDANRAWTLEQAIQFGQALNQKENSDARSSSSSTITTTTTPSHMVVSLVAQAVEYIEEPLQNPTKESLSEFYRKTRLNIALDESVDEGLFGLGDNTSKEELLLIPEGVTTLVLKPSVLGGFLPTLKLAEHATRKQQSQQQLQCVVSSCFESPLGILQLSYLAAVVDASTNSSSSRTAVTEHGLGTGEWWYLKNQPEEISYKVGSKLTSRIYLQGLDKELITPEYPAILDLTTENVSLDSENVDRSVVEVQTAVGKYSFSYLETLPSLPSTASTTTPTGTTATVVFLHGFLGQPEEWLPFMKAFSTAATAVGGVPTRCLALCLPGHGSSISPERSSEDVDDAYSLEYTAAAIEIALETLDVADCVVVGYSLGARLALLLSSRSREPQSNSSKLKISKVVSISGSPGLPEDDLQKRKERLKEDAERAEKLRNQGLENFLAAWYSAPMWDTLTRDHTHVFTRILETRKRGLLSQNLDLSSLSLTLEIMSPGRAPDVQPELYRLSSQGKLPQMLLVAGKQDAKFVDIANTLAQDLPQNAQSQTVEAVVVENCGHTVHVEQPIRLLTILFDFISSHIE